MNTLAFLQNLSGYEILLIFLVVLLFFGAKRLPELFRSMGKSVKEFKKATQEIEDEVRNAMDSEDEPKKPSQPAQPKVEASENTKDKEKS
ncbi:Sec-independent protein translocase subunit TatA/TatB [Coraliomargarita parva]|uniref:Sec-independent protein translocase subunit TatA/TatB n=1 Tax=Coraliomargarita parva TaxID=3014050 RepID=UPI0022B2CD69|nr:twin-arginine translocase TatA/TatE family subunit [Coraliomargarita parva]